MAVKFSFVIPTRNEALYLEDCLKSIRSQTRKDYEIIVTDTLSTDGTQAMAKRYGGKVITEPRRGPAIARNTGAKASRGDILVFADADVRFDKDFLEKIDVAMSNRTIAGGVCKLLTYDAKGALFTRSYWAVNLIVKFLNMIGVAVTGGSCFIYRRDVFERANGFNPKLFTNEDHDMAQRASKLGRFVFFGKVSIHTSVRRVARLGFQKMLRMYIKSTAVYMINKDCIRDYW